MSLFLPPKQLSSSRRKLLHLPWLQSEDAVDQSCTWPLMNGQCGQKVNLCSCRPLRHGGHLSPEHSLTWPDEVLRVKQRILLVLSFRGVRGRKTQSEVLGAGGNLEAPKWAEGALEEEPLALAFVPALPSHSHQIPLNTLHCHQGDRASQASPWTGVRDLMKLEMWLYSSLGPWGHADFWPLWPQLPSWPFPSLCSGKFLNGPGLLHPQGFGTRSFDFFFRSRVYHHFIKEAFLTLTAKSRPTL